MSKAEATASCYAKPVLRLPWTRCTAHQHYQESALKNSANMRRKSQTYTFPVFISRERTPPVTLPSVPVFESGQKNSSFEGPPLLPDDIAGLGDLFRADVGAPNQHMWHAWIYSEGWGIFKIRFTLNRHWQWKMCRAQVKSVSYEWLARRAKSGVRVTLGRGWQERGHWQIPGS